MVEVSRTHVTDDAAERIGAELDRRGLGAVARLLVDAHRPLAPLASDLGVALGGVLGAVGGRAASSLRSLIEDERALDRLAESLDDAEELRAESS